MRLVINYKRIMDNLNNSINFWVQVSQAKYGKIDPWESIFSRKVSRLWNAITVDLKFVYNYLSKSIRNQENTCTIKHPWCTNIPLAYKPTMINCGNIFAEQVSSLIKNRAWKLNKIGNQASNEIIQNICKIPLVPTLRMTNGSRIKILTGCLLLN